MLGSSSSPRPTMRAARPPPTRFLIRIRTTSRSFRSPSSSCRSSFSQARPNQRMSMFEDAISTSMRWPSLRGVGSVRAILTGRTRASIGRPGSAGRVRRPTTESGISSTVPRHFVGPYPSAVIDDWRPQCDPCGVELVDLGLDPEPVQVGDRDDRRPRLGDLAELDVPRGDHAVDRRGDAGLGDQGVEPVAAGDRGRRAGHGPTPGRGR